MKADSAYTRLFENKLMIEMLLRAWLAPEVVQALDFNSMLFRPQKNHDEDGNLRTGDILLSMGARHGGKGLWLYVMIETQATAQRLMALRLHAYCTLFWHRIKNDEKLSDDDCRPFILPIVIYPGHAAWQYQTDSMKDCFELPEDSPLYAYGPSMRYLLIDVQRLELGSLWKLENPLGWSFILQQKLSDPAVCKHACRLLDTWCKTHKHPEVIHAMRLLLRELKLSRLRPPTDVNSSLNPEEEAMSLAEAYDLWATEAEKLAEQKGRHEGHHEGLVEGEQKGRHEGLAEGEQKGSQKSLRYAAKRLLESKFDALGLRFWQDHLAPLDLAPWDIIFDAIFDAKTLDALSRYKRPHLPKNL